MRLIDADALLEKLAKDPLGKTVVFNNNLDGVIKSMPTIALEGLTYEDGFKAGANAVLDIFGVKAAKEVLGK